jgi:hypothetical protein
MWSEKQRFTAETRRRAKERREDEAGVFRLLEPVKLQEGAEVRTSSCLKIRMFMLRPASTDAIDNAD